MDNIPDRAHPDDRTQPSANPDSATNPAHYTRLDPEPITVIESWGLGFCLGNALKYIARAGHKPGTSTVDDLAKARWYIDRALGGGELTAVDIDQVIAAWEHWQTEAKRWELIARTAGDRIRELQEQLVNAGLREVRDVAPAPRALPDFDVGGES